MTVGERIKEVRVKTGMSQVEFADKINVSKQTLYKYENNLITNIPSDKIEAVARVGGVSPAELMGWDIYEDPNILKRDTSFEDIEKILNDDGYSLCCETYDDDFFIIKDSNGQIVAGFYGYELLARYESLKKKHKLSANLLISAESAFFKYLESLGYYIVRDDPDHKPFIRCNIGTARIDSNKLNDIRTRIDVYAKAMLDSVILKLNEEELKRERLEKEKILKHLSGEDIYSNTKYEKDLSHLIPDAAHERTDIELTDNDQKHDDDIMNDDSNWG